MIKRRFGEEFHATIAERLEIKQVEDRKAAGDRKRKPYNKDNKGPKRQPREGKPAVEGQEAQKTAEQKPAVEGQAAKTEAPKREARRRGPREGQ